MNYGIQRYKGIVLQLIKLNYTDYKAKRYKLGETIQNVWIPIKHLEQDGTIKQGENLDYVFRKAQRQLELADIPGRYRESIVDQPWPYVEALINHAKADRMAAMCGTNKLVAPGIPLVVTIPNVTQLISRVYTYSNLEENIPDFLE
ncbi:hypothetical protein D3C76_179030 [compost metagenome]